MVGMKQYFTPTSGSLVETPEGIGRVIDILHRGQSIPPKILVRLMDNTEQWFWNTKIKQLEPRSRPKIISTRFQDLSGQQFAHLTVINRADNLYGSTAWLCRCICGTEKVVSGSNLKSGNAKSCGCMRNENKKGRGFHRTY
jgi:hypothetical protein